MIQSRELHHYHLSRDAANWDSLDLRVVQSQFAGKNWTRILFSDASRQEIDIEAPWAPAGFCRRSGWTVERLV